MLEPHLGRQSLPLESSFVTYIFALPVVNRKDALGQCVTKGSEASIILVGGMVHVMKKVSDGIFSQKEVQAFVILPWVKR